MPLGTREVLLIMHAQDRASSTFQTIGRNFGNLDDAAQKAAARQMQTGAALMGVGAGIAAIGSAGIAVYAEMGKAALEYNRQSVLTMTQTQGLGITLEQIKNTARDVAREIPVPLKQLQGSLYDIFSSMDVNLAESRILLEAFARGAVAGQVEIQKSAQATIGLMNAFKVPIKDVNKVMDLQFQLVATGVGTYDQFAGVLGLVSPSAVRAGQSIEAMAGMMAFLTRNGLSTSAAAAAAGRALDSVANPKTIQHFKDMGLTITDANGQFRPMVDIVQDMANKFQDLNPEQRSKALKELFQSSGGTIQAMRFWNTAVQNVPALKEYTQEMYNAGGAMDNAFRMFEEHDPGFQMQLLKNNMDVLATEVGDKFIPVLAKLSTWGIKLLEWFDKLNPSVKNTVMVVGLLVPVITVLLGVVVGAIGLFMAISAAAAFVGVSFGALVAIVGAIAAAIVGLATAAVLLYNNWTPVKKFFDDFGKTMGQWRNTANEALDTVQKAWALFLLGFQNPDRELIPGLAAFTTFFITLGQITGQTVQFVQDIWGGLVSFWNTILVPALQTVRAWFETVFNFISFAISAAWVVIEPIFNFLVDILTNQVIPVVTVLGKIFLGVMEAIGAVIGFWFNSIFKPIFNFTVKMLTDFVFPAIELLAKVFGTAFQAAVAVIQFFWSIFSVIIQMIVGLIVAILRPAVQGIADTFSSVFHAVGDVVSWAWNSQIKPIWNLMVSFWDAVLYPMIKKIGEVWGDVWRTMSNSIGPAWSLIASAIKSGVNSSIDVLNGFLKAATDVVNGVIDIYNKIPGAPAVSKISAPHVSKLHTGGLVTGANALRNDEVLRVLQVGEGVVNKRAMASLGTTGLSNLNSGRGNGGNTLNINEGAIVVHVNGADPSTVQRQVQEGVADALSDLYREMRAA